MCRPVFRWAAIIQIGLTLMTGCHPTQPFFVARDESRANYIAQMLDIEYPDVHVDSLPEATQARIPYGPDSLPDDFQELSLEDCISIALQNAKILRVVNGLNTQSGSVAASHLSAQPGQLPSIYDPALIATTASSQPLTVDGQGNRVAPRGLIRSNQVGGVEDALSEFDAQFSALYGYSTTDRPRNVGAGNIFNPQFFQAVDSNAQAALSKRLATGTVATARLSTVYSRNNITPGNVGRSVPSDYTTAIEIQATQPLLRGRGTLVNRIPVVLARINEDIELHQFEANVRNLVKSVEDAYWDLYLAYRSVEASKEAQERALTLWRVAKNRLAGNTNTRPEFEAQARGLYEQFNARVRTALYGTRVSSAGTDPLGLYGRERVLREKMGLGATDGLLIRPSDEPTIALIEFDWPKIQAEALTRNTELRRQKWAIKQRELELILAKNQILPQLDAVLLYRWLGVGDILASSNRTGLSFPAVGSSAIEELTGGDYQELSARLEYTPNAMGKRRPLTNIQNAQINLVKFQEELREKENYLMFELSQSWTLMESSYQSMYDYSNQWNAHEDEASIYIDRIEVDPNQIDGNMDQLLRAEERSAQVQLQYFQAVTEYNKALASIHYLKGSLLDLNNISLAEGPWMDKAYWDAEERAAERAGGTYFDYGYTRPAVVSQGPVESGVVTEGNVSKSGETFGKQAEGLEYTPDENGNLSPGDAEEIDPPAEPTGPVTLAPSRLRSASHASATRRGSILENNRVRSSAGFEWGDLGMNARREPAALSDAGARPLKDHQPNARPQTRSIPVTGTRMTLSDSDMGVSSEAGPRRSGGPWQSR